MDTNNVRLWDFWSKRYSRLWVQNWVLGPTRRAVIEAVRSLPDSPRRILDLGCGIGQLCREVAAEFPDAALEGVDVSPGMVEQAAAGPTLPNVSFRRGDLSDCVGPYDVIVSTHSFPYIPDKDDALRTIRDLLVPGGVVCIAMSHIDTMYDRVAMGIVKMTTWKAEYTPSKRLQQLMETAGFTDVDRRPLPLRWFLPSIYLTTARRGD